MYEIDKVKFGQFIGQLRREKALSINERELAGRLKQRKGNIRPFFLLD